MLQTIIGVRIVVPGDGTSKRLKLNLKKTIFHFADGRYGFLPMKPDSIVSMSIGGPNMSPEMGHFVLKAELSGNTLTVDFAAPLQLDPERYTIEIIFGYNTMPVEDPGPEVLIGEQHEQ